MFLHIYKEFWFASPIKKKEKNHHQNYTVTETVHIGCLQGLM